MIVLPSACVGGSSFYRLFVLVKAYLIILLYRSIGELSFSYSFILVNYCFVIPLSIYINYCDNFLTLLF